MCKWTEGPISYVKYENILERVFSIIYRYPKVIEV